MKLRNRLNLIYETKVRYIGNYEAIVKLRSFTWKQQTGTLIEFKIIKTCLRPSSRSLSWFYLCPRITPRDYIFYARWWSSGRIVPCHGTDPGSIPGQCNEHRTFEILNSEEVISSSSVRDNFRHYKCKLCLDHQQRNTLIIVCWESSSNVV